MLPPVSMVPIEWKQLTETRAAWAGFWRCLSGR
jgi:hypothetical protein